MTFATFPGRDPSCCNTVFYIRIPLQPLIPDGCRLEDVFNLPRVPRGTITLGDDYVRREGSVSGQNWIDLGRIFPLANGLFLLLAMPKTQLSHLTMNDKSQKMY